jgi:hypothetical protein
VLITHATLTTYLVTAFDGAWQFLLFHMSFGPAKVYAVYQIFQLYRSHKATKKDHEINLVFEFGMVFYLLSIVCWFTDMFACEFVNPHYPEALLTINPQLHAFWHLFISMGLYKY